jgi:bifunctional non-homologous end joining protein LigD
MPLERYKRKRNFNKSPEPKATVSGQPVGLIFVVQKHAAHRLHYDLRLALDGVLKSWAVPHGPSLDPRQKRLAVMVEDHPIDYANFEGVIPKGEYGAGRVIVWDTGTYEPDSDGKPIIPYSGTNEDRIRAGLAKGKLSFALHGKKLNGSWALVRMARDPQNWLLIKHRDAFAGAEKDILEEGKSVLSGRTIEQLKTGEAATTGRSIISIDELEKLPGAKMAPMPVAISPMLAQLRSAPPSGQDWVFEPKLDNFRIIAQIDNSKVTLRSRNDTDMTTHFPAVVDDLEKLNVSPAVLDGEIVALDDKGKTCFQCLQQLTGLPHEHTGKQFITVYYVFDVLYYDGFNLMQVAWEKRNHILNQLVLSGTHIKPIDHYEGDGTIIYEAAIAIGMEGIVAKNKQSPYLAGKRSATWIKVKSTLSDEFVIGGFAAGSGKRSGDFASLMLGYYDKDRLIYAGSVGTGFNALSLMEIKKKLTPLIIDKEPFSARIQPMEGVTWVKPRLVVEVKFAEWTPAGLLRAPVFLRLREDKAAADIRHVRVQEPPPFSDKKVVALSRSTQQILETLQSQDDEIRVQSGGYEIPLSGLNKVFWPELSDRPALTKRNYLVYLAEVADFILPHVKDRPLTLTRYPNGIYRGKFYQKHWESKLPDFVKTTSIYSKENDTFQDYLVCNNLATLIWLGQIADLELHTWYSRVAIQPDRADIAAYNGKPEHLDNYLAGIPDFVIFDIDPYIYSGKEMAGEEPDLNLKAFQATVEAAFWLKEVIESL